MNGPRTDSVPEGTELVEQLAAIEHDRWSHWQQYVHGQCVPGSDGSLTIPADLVRRWSTQMTTPYRDLAELEKESDREQVRRYLPVIIEVLKGAAGSDLDP